MIVGSNAFFLTFWAYKMYQETKAMLIKKFQKVYLYVCLCNNPQKLQRLILKTQIEEEHELLREDLMKGKDSNTNIYSGIWV